jgi:hypothetical protein
VVRPGSPIESGTIRNASDALKLRTERDRSAASSHDTPGYEPVSARGSTMSRLPLSATPGSGVRTTACSQENTAVLTPMPTASDRTMTVASTGMLAMARSA